MSDTPIQTIPILPRISKKRKEHTLVHPIPIRSMNTELLSKRKLSYDRLPSPLPRIFNQDGGEHFVDIIN